MAFTGRVYPSDLPLQHLQHHPQLRPRIPDQGDQGRTNHPTTSHQRCE